MQVLCSPSLGVAVSCQPPTAACAGVAGISALHDDGGHGFQLPAAAPCLARREVAPEATLAAGRPGRC